MEKEKIGNYRYLDFSDIIPEDEYLYKGIVVRSQHENDNLIINWGRSFPWTLDDRLSLSCQFDEKTICSINERQKGKKCSIIPLIPLFGGMEFLLSFPSYLYMRIDRNNCSVINPKAPGAVSIIESIIEDYLSIFTNTQSVAFDMRYFDLCLEKVNGNDLVRFFSKIYSVLKNQINDFIIICRNNCIDRIFDLLSEAGFENYRAACLDDRKSFKCSKTEPDKFISIADSGTEYYFDGKEKEEYQQYLKKSGRIWENIIDIKNELLKYQIFEFSVRVKNFDIIQLFSETEDLFSIILSDGKYLSSLLKGKIRYESVYRLFRRSEKVIEYELGLIKAGLDNYFIELDNCL